MSRDGQLPGITQSRSLPRIAIATNNGDIGGGEVMLIEIAHVLRGMGLGVTILGPTVPGDLVELAEAAGFDTLPLRANTRRRYMAALASWRLRHRHIPLWCNGLVPSTATAGLGPRLVHLHLVPKGLRRVAAWISAIGARRVLVPSSFMAEGGGHRTVLANWTQDVTRPSRCEASPRAESASIRIGFLGRLTRDKGVDVFAHAVRRLIESGHPITCVVAGENRFGTSADDRVISVALSSIARHTELLGWVSREDFFADVDLAVFPSVFQEPFGLVVAEAMASGTPFVISDAGALPEVAGPSHPWVARAGDAESLAEQIELAIRAIRDGSAASVTSAARERWGRRYSPEAGMRRVQRLLATLDQPAPGPDLEDA